MMAAAGRVEGDGVLTHWRAVDDDDAAATAVVALVRARLRMEARPCRGIGWMIYTTDAGAARLGHADVLGPS